MPTVQNYIATWFYKESKEEASFYPQAGKTGDSELVHSIYMQIQVPFFTTFRHYNPDAKLLFFTNVEQLPHYLDELFAGLDVEIVRLPYRCIPPKGWYKAWRNQFYLYDIWQYMDSRMQAADNLLICDADCLCTASLTPLFEESAACGSALYEFTTDAETMVNGITLKEMNELYEACYGEKPSTPLYYYGGEFIVLRGDKVKAVNEAYRPLWEYNLQLFADARPKLNEEALFFSVLAERLHIRNDIANRYTKRMWTSPRFNNVKEGDESLAVWHLPYEKKRGLYYLYRLLRKQPFIADEKAFWKKAAFYTGIPRISARKKLKDLQTALWQKIRF